MTARHHIDVTAPDRATATGRIMWAHLPTLAKRHLYQLVAAENYVHGGRRNPDRPLRVRASFIDHGSYVAIERCSLTYPVAPCR